MNGKMENQRTVGGICEVDQRTTNPSIARRETLTLKGLEVDLVLRQARLHECLDR